MWAEYPHWKTIQSFAMTQLRDEGMGKSTLEPKIMEEFNLYVDYFPTPHLGQPVDLTDSLNLATSNVISLMLFGKRRQYSDDTFWEWKHAFDDKFKTTMIAAIWRNIPLANYLPGESHNDNYFSLGFVPLFCSIILSLATEREGVG